MRRDGSFAAMLFRLLLVVIGVLIARSLLRVVARLFQGRQEPGVRGAAFEPRSSETRFDVSEGDVLDVPFTEVETTPEAAKRSGSGS